MPAERLFPQNIEAERAVLGSLLIDPEALVLVADCLSSEDFYRDAHRIIYGAMLRLYDHHTPTDVLMVCDQLEQQHQLEEVGGLSTLLSLADHVPTSAHAVYYGRLVARTALLRRLIHAGTQIVALAYEESGEDATQTLEQAEQMIFSISQRYNSATGTASHVGDLMASYMERLDQVHARRGMVVGVPTGLTDLDRLLGGLQRSDLIVLAGRPGMGKSSAGLSMAYHAARFHRRNVGLFSLEMSKEQLIQRLVAMDAGVDQQRLRTGWIEDEEWERIIASLGTISDLGLWLDDSASLSTLQLRSKARRWVLEHHLDLIIVDYLQLLYVSTEQGRKIENRTQEVGQISRSLKGLARELNIPVLALAQLSRAVETRTSKVPQLSDLRESGAIEADADVVLFIYRDDAYHAESERPNTAEIIVAKHRNGPVGTVTLAFDKQQMRLRNLSFEPSGEEGEGWSRE